MNFIFDWDSRYKQGIIKCNELNLIREHFSVANKAAKFSHNKFIPQRKYVITPQGRFDIGMFGEIYKFIKSLNINFNVTTTEQFIKKYKCSYKNNISSNAVLSMDLRDYQKSACKEAFENGRGVVVLPTASGKTLTMASLIQTLRKNNISKQTLIIVPSIQLVEQTYKDFINYGIDINDISKWSGDNELVIKPIIIAGISILQSEKQNIDFIKNIDLLIWDECHKIRRENLNNKIFKLINTNHIFGFTGTLPEDKLDTWNIIGKIGPVIYKQESEQLRQEKYIADVMVNIIEIDYNSFKPSPNSSLSDDPTKLYDEELEFLINNNFRNTLISKLATHVNKNILILVERISHGQLLFDMINKMSNKKVYFIKGDMEVFDREQIRNLMEKHDDVICVAMSQIFSTGISINNLPYILFAIMGKAKVKLIQSIGRGLRLHENKGKLIIYDLADKLRYGKKHIEKRINLYETEKINYEIRNIKESTPNKN